MSLDSLPLSDPAPATSPDLATAQNRTPSHIAPPAQVPNDLPAPQPVTTIRLPPPSHHPLSARQLNAIPLVLIGLTDEKVALQVGVRREAVCNWRNRHPAFIAELNRQRQLLHSTTLDRYNHLLHQAMDLFEQFHANENYGLREKVKSASVLLRAASRRTFAATPVGPTNPADILDLLLSQSLTPAPDDSPADDAPPLPPTPQKTPASGRRKPKPPTLSDNSTPSQEDLLRSIFLGTQD